MKAGPTREEELAGRASLRSSRPAAASIRWSLELPRGRTLELGGRPLVMGVLNITPDSFSDGGRWLALEQAVEHGLEMLDAGADLLDLGAESTRPGGGIYGAGAREVPAGEEIERLLPVLEGLRRETDRALSVDTRKGVVARQALGAGADLINDVSALADPETARAVADYGCPVVLMHSRGDLATMQSDIQFDDVVAEVREELAGRIVRGEKLGVAAEQVILDPGIGFGKRVSHNVELIARLGRLQELGRPLLVGASRKSFLGELTGREPGERLAGSLAAAAWAAQSGAALLRVHDVAPTVELLTVWGALEERV